MRGEAGLLQVLLGRSLKMIEKFEEDDDVSGVYHNLELTEELLTELENS